jgi:hypothetical protein
VWSTRKRISQQGAVGRAMESVAWNTRPRPAVAEAARTAQRPGLILAASDAVGTLGGSTPLPWHAPPRLCGEPSAGAVNQLIRDHKAPGLASRINSRKQKTKRLETQHC